MKRVYNRSDYFGVRGDSVFVLVRLGGWVGGWVEVGVLFL